MKNKRLNHVINFCNQVFDDTTEVGALPDIDALYVYRKKPFAVSGVYFLFDRDEIVYIGKSSNVMKRIAQHSSKTKDNSSHLSYNENFNFETYSYIYVPEEDMNEVERLLIGKYKPKYNSRIDIQEENGDVSLRKIKNAACGGKG